MLPADLRNNEAYKVIFGVLDSQVARLNENVLMYKRKLQESKACWRQRKMRQSRPADDCPWSGYYVQPRGSIRVCKRDGALLQTELGRAALPLTPDGRPETLLEMLSSAVRDLPANASSHNGTALALILAAQSGSGAGLAVSLSLEGSLLGKQSRPSPSPPSPPSPQYRDPLCRSGSGFEDQINGMCYKTCNSGFAPYHKDRTACMNVCWGDFGYMSEPMGLMCGADPQILAMIVTEMIIAILSAAFNVAQYITQMVQGGRVNADSLSGIIQSLIKLGVAFTLPQCSVNTGLAGTM